MKRLYWNKRGSDIESKRSGIGVSQTKVPSSVKLRFFLVFKGSDRQSEVVELSMQYCAQIL